MGCHLSVCGLLSKCVWVVVSVYGLSSECVGGHQTICGLSSECKSAVIRVNVGCHKIGCVLS